MKARIRGTLYEASTIRNKKVERLLNEKNRSQASRIFRTVATSPKPLSAVEVVDTITRPKIPMFNVRWHLSKFRRDGLLLASAALTQKAPTTALAKTNNNLTLTIPTQGFTNEVMTRIKRWVTITIERSEVFARLTKATNKDGLLTPKEAMIAIGFFEITEPVQKNQLIERIREGAQTSLRAIGAHA